MSTSIHGELGLAHAAAKGHIVGHPERRIDRGSHESLPGLRFANDQNSTKQVQEGRGGGGGGIDRDNVLLRILPHPCDKYSTHTACSQHSSRTPAVCLAYCCWYCTNGCVIRHVESTASERLDRRNIWGLRSGIDLLWTYVSKRRQDQR